MACNVSHGLEYEVKHQMHKSWVSAERLLPPQSALHVGSHNAHLAQEGCLVSGQVMLSLNPKPTPNPHPHPSPLTPQPSLLTPQPSALNPHPSPLTYPHPHPTPHPTPGTRCLLAGAR